MDEQPAAGWAQVAPPVWAEKDVNFYDESDNAHCKFTRKEICFINHYIMQNNYPSHN